MLVDELDEQDSMMETLWLSFPVLNLFVGIEKFEWVSKHTPYIDVMCIYL